MDKEAESFEIRSSTVHSNFTVESKTVITQQYMPKLEIYDTLECRLLMSVTYLCFLCIFTKMVGYPMYVNAFN